MIDDRFDALARRLAGDAPKVARGSLLRRFSAALVGGGVAAAVLAPDASAAKKKITCPAGHVLCKGKCRDAQIDPDACGKCNHVCKANQVCRNGRCVTMPCTCLPDCPQGTTRCGATCVDTTTSNTNCGSCGTTCSGSETCRAGTCTGPVCGNGLLEAGEQCDGPALAGATCQSLGYVGGTLACSNVCQFDTTGCIPACTSAADCGQSTDCVTYTCMQGTCGTSFASAGAAVTVQTPGDCRKVVCNGAGGTATVNDDSDLPITTNGCVTPTCSNGTPSQPSKTDGTACVGPQAVPGLCMGGVCQ